MHIYSPVKHVGPTSVPSPITTNYNYTYISLAIVTMHINKAAEIRTFIVLQFRTQPKFLGGRGMGAEGQGGQLPLNLYLKVEDLCPPKSRLSLDQHTNISPPPNQERGQKRKRHPTVYRAGGGGGPGRVFICLSHMPYSNIMTSYVYSTGR